MPFFFLSGPACRSGDDTVVEAGRKKLFAFVDDIFFVTKPDDVREMHSLAQQEFLAQCRIQVHADNTRMCGTEGGGGAGQKFEVCDNLQKVAELEDPTARVWRG